MKRLPGLSLIFGAKQSIAGAHENYFFVLRVDSNGLDFELVSDQMEIFLRQVLGGDLYVIEVQGVPVHEQDAADGKYQDKE